MSELTQIYNDLVGLKAELWEAAEGRLRAEFGLPLRYFQVMSVIDRRGSCRIVDVAADLVIGDRAAKKLICHMEAEGYCRRGDSRDRASRLELTARGRSLVIAAGRAFDDELERWFGAAAPAPMLDQFAAALKRLRRSGIVALSSTRGAP
jgi:DNA-binding MarR family transcriptional regulator